MAENEFNPRHPHESDVPAVLDGDGRCLVCSAFYAVGELAREIGRLHLEIEALIPAVDLTPEQRARFEAAAERGLAARRADLQQIDGQDAYSERAAAYFDGLRDAKEGSE
jgi:hypothetical protein